MSEQHKFNRPSDEQGVFEPDMAEELDTTADKWAQMAQDSGLCPHTARFCAALHEKSVAVEMTRELARRLSNIIGRLVKTKNYELERLGLCFAAGIDWLNGLSMTDAARGIKVTRAMVSKCTIRWSDIIGLGPSRYMKSKKSREVYSHAQSSNHWRNRKASQTIKDDILK